jgi:hypothetical protein
VGVPGSPCIIVSLGLDFIHIESGVDTPVSKIVDIDADVPFGDA